MQKLGDAGINKVWKPCVCVVHRCQWQQHPGLTEFFPPGSGLPNTMFLTDQHGESMHQRERLDEEINVSDSLAPLPSLPRRGLIAPLKAIEWTRPEGTAHSRY